MIVETDDEFEALRAIGRICADTLQAMRLALEPGMTTQELDDIGRRLLDQAGAVSAPEGCYNFPGATCISVNEEAAHGIPGPRVIMAGDLVNIDVSASKDGFFADCGASQLLGKGHPMVEALVKDGKRAMNIGLKEVMADAPLANIGRAVGAFAKSKGYTLVENLCSHGIGRSLHEEPTEIPTWPVKRDRRIIKQGLVLTVEPFLSLGATWADTREDDWTLYGDPEAPVVQFEHTVVAGKNGPIILTLPSAS